MPPISPIKRKDLIRNLKRLGLDGSRLAARPVKL